MNRYCVSTHGTLMVWLVTMNQQWWNCVACLSMLGKIQMSFLYRRPNWILLKKIMSWNYQTNSNSIVFFMLQYKAQITVDGGIMGSVFLLNKVYNAKFLTSWKISLMQQRSDLWRLWYSPLVSATSTKIYFFNLYFPCFHFNDPARDEERAKWLGNMQKMCEKYKDNHVVWVGDFNAMRHNPVLSPNMKNCDPRCIMFDEMQKLFNDNGFVNVADVLWRKNVFTRFGVANTGNYSFSTLDYVVTSAKMQQLNHTVEPVYNEKVIWLSDHIDLKCSIRMASNEHPKISEADKINVIPPVFDERVRELSCPYCEVKCARPSNLILHIRVHTGEKPFSCVKMCGYRSARIQHMTGHDAICTGPFIIRRCETPHCVASTPVQRQLNKHVKMCTKRRSEMDQTAIHKCWKCSFTTNSTLHWDTHEHSIKHVSENPLIWYSCVPCNYFSDNKTDYNIHLNTRKHLNIVE